MTVAIPVLRIVSGSPSDPFFSSVVLLSPCDGSNGDTSTPNLIFGAPTPLTGGGTSTLSTTQAKFGPTSIAVNGGSNNFANNAGSATYWNFGTGAFTIEFWAYLTATGAVNVYDMRPNANGAFATFFCNTGGTANYLTSSTTRITSAAGKVIANQWQFWAYSKQTGSGGTGELSIDGTVVGSWSDTTTYGNASVWTGGASSFGLSFSGFMDEMRMTKGVARYSGNFTPPTKAFPKH